MPDASFVCAADALTGWRDDVRSGKAPELFPVGKGELGRIEIGPGTVVLLGGAPGAGKTAFTMQAVVPLLQPGRLLLLQRHPVIVAGDSLVLHRPFDPVTAIRIIRTVPARL